MKRTLRYYFLLLFLTPLVYTGCVKNNLSVGKIIVPPVIPSVADTLGKSYLALGDSYTIGEGVSASERYPAQAAVLLRQKGIFFGSVEYIAQTGWTTSNLAGAIASKNPANNYDLVTLMIGVNDQYQKNDSMSSCRRRSL